MKLEKKGGKDIKIKGREEIGKIKKVKGEKIVRIDIKKLEKEILKGEKMRKGVKKIMWWK